MAIDASELAGIVFEIRLKPVLKFTRSISGANGWRERDLRLKAGRLDFPYCEHY